MEPWRLMNDPLFGSGSQNAQSGTFHSSRWMSSSVPFGLLKMAKEIQVNKAKDENFVFSPCSIQLALSLLTNGSKGEALKELLCFLEAGDLNDQNLVAAGLIESLTIRGATLSFIGGVWIDQFFTLNPNFKTVAKDAYRAKAEVVDFQNKASDIITVVNKWAEEATNGLIKSILPDNLDPLTRFILANALYFKGTWAQKFDKLRTRKNNFYVPNGNVVSVPFMTSYEDQFIATFNDFKVLRLPYEKTVSAHSDLSMYVILPNERDGFWPLVHKVASDPSFLKTSVSSYGEKVKVGEFRLPKFTMTCECDASRILEDLGLKSPFSDEAEFNEMVHEGELKVSNIFHKSCIEVNEEGTEAAAVTVIGVAFGSAPIRRQLVDFVADHPFMFLVRDDGNGTVLFMGHVINPAL